MTNILKEIWLDSDWLGKGLLLLVLGNHLSIILAIIQALLTI
jgi:hypothetical protein